MVDIRLYPKNFDTYEAKKTLIHGIGKVHDDVVIFYESSSRDVQVLIVQNGTVIHKCRASENSNYYRTGCWHLAAAATVLDLKPGDVISVVVATSEFPEKIHQDLTPGILGRPGNFPVPVEAPGEEELSLPDWARKYRIPPALVTKIEVFRAEQENRLRDEQKSRIPKAAYIASGDEVARAIAALLYDGSWEAPLLIGQRGTGKSTMAETVASLLNLPVRKIFGGIDLNAEALLGSKTLTPMEGIDFTTEARLRVAAKKAGLDPEPLFEKLRGAQLRIEFEPGLLLKAVLDGEMIVIDEVNMLNPEVTSLLHGLLDWQKVLAVPGYGQVKAHPSFRLIACMNPGYAGTKSLNEAFQDRFRSIKVPYLPQHQMAQLLTEYIDITVADKLADLFLGLTERVRNGDLSERVLSFRSLIRASKEFRDGLGNLREVVMSNLTEALDDQFEVWVVKDIVESRIPA